jgi:lipoprotein signal peptidase
VSLAPIASGEAAARLRLGLPIALATLLADQVSKWAMLHPLALPEVRNIPLFSLGAVGLDLSMVWNRGVTFGLLWGEALWAQLLLALVAAAIAIFLLRWMARAETPWVAAALGAVAGGAIGNVIDRLRFGGVVDFLDFYIGGWHWYVFNVADAGIVCGVGVLIADALFRRAPGAK